VPGGGVGTNEEEGGRERKGEEGETGPGEEEK
jgi:hypothetical protein